MFYRKITSFLPICFEMTVIGFPDDIVTLKYRYQRLPPRLPARSGNHILQSSHYVKNHSLSGWDEVVKQLLVATLPGLLIMTSRHTEDKSPNPNILSKSAVYCLCQPYNGPNHSYISKFWPVLGLSTLTSFQVWLRLFVCFFVRENVWQRHSHLWVTVVYLILFNS